MTEYGELEFESDYTWGMAKLTFSNGFYIYGYYSYGEFMDASVYTSGGSWIGDLVPGIYVYSDGKCEIPQGVLCCGREESLDECFEGELDLDGERHGECIIKYSDGSRFEGYYHHGEKSGKGVFTSGTGKTFLQMWERGYLINEDEVHVEKEKKFFRGYYIGELNGDDKMYGKGTFYWYNGDKYEGDFIDEIRTGKGVFTWANGNRYEGDFKNNKMHGKGVFYWENGDKYDGDFENDNMHGKGVFYWKNGEKYEGEFAYNKRHRDGVFTDINGEKFQQKWSFGSLSSETKIKTQEMEYWFEMIINMVKSTKNKKHWKW